MASHGFTLQNIFTTWRYIYKKSTFQGFYKSILYLSPELTLTDPHPLVISFAQFNGPLNAAQNVMTRQEIYSSYRISCAIIHIFKPWRNSDFLAFQVPLFVVSKTVSSALAKLLEFHILELKISNFLIQYIFLTCEHFPYYGLLHAILMPIVKGMNTHKKI